MHDERVRVVNGRVRHHGDGVFSVRRPTLTDPTLKALKALADAVGDDAFVTQLLYFAAEPAFEELARAVMEASPSQRAWLARNASRLMSDVDGGPKTADRGGPPIRLVADD